MFLFNKDRFRFSVVNSFTGTGGGAPGVISDQPKINNGEWHHIAAVRDEDNKELRAYINGELVGRVADFTRSLNIAEGGRKKIWLGIHRPGHEDWHLAGVLEGNGFFPATIDEVRFWGKAMNQADVMKVLALAVDSFGKRPLTWGDINTTLSST